MRYSIIVAVLLVLLPSAASAYRCTGPRSDPPNYVTVKIEAERGNAIAQFILGQYYDAGFKTSSIFVEKNESEALDWYKKSADQGYTEAQQRVGFKAKADKNYEEAFFWVSLGGHAEIARQIARDRLTPEQVAKINHRIDEWKPTVIVPPPLNSKLQALKEKAEAGDANAQIELGDAFAHLPREQRRCDENEHMDDPIFRNLFEAEKWWRMAAEQGHVGGQNRLAGAYRSRRNYLEAIHWATKAAEQGDREATWSLQGIYKGEIGAVPTGQEPNYEKAYFWLLVAGNLGGRGPIDSWQKNITDHLPSSQIAAVEKQAKEWKPRPNSVSMKTLSPSDIKLRELAEGGSPRAQYELGMQYEAGQLANFDEAERWYLKSAENRFAQGQYFLARLYVGKKQNREAEKWFRKAAEQGHNAAQVELSNLYRRSDLAEIKQNLEEAYYWFSIATLNNQQYSRSREELGQKLTLEQRTAIDRRAEEFKPNPSPETEAFQKQ